jgi:hypothetical protein
MHRKLPKWIWQEKEEKNGPFNMQGFICQSQNRREKIQFGRKTGRSFFLGGGIINNSKRNFL